MISSTPSPGPGPTARRASNSRLWNGSKSWQRWCPCHGGIWCAMGGVWRPTVNGAAPSCPPPSTGSRGTCGAPQGAALGLGAAAQAGVCSRYGPLSVLPSGSAADHCRDSPGGSDPKDPPPSETFSDPPPIAPARSGSVIDVMLLPQSHGMVGHHYQLIPGRPAVSDAPQRCLSTV